MTARPKWLLFIVLMAVWAGLLVWMFSETREPQHVPLKYTSGQKAGREAGRVAASGLKVNLDLLTANRQQTEKSFGAPRNIFAPLKREEPQTVTTAELVAKNRARAQRAKAVVTPPPAPVPPSQPVPEAPPPPSPEELAKQAGRQELAQYRYLGYLSRGGRDEAFLSKGKDLLIVKTGETIEQRIVVKAIAPTGVTLQETISHVEQTVALLPESK